MLRTGRRATLFAAMLIAAVCVAQLAHALCIDYRDYLHGLGGLELPDFASGVALYGSYACVADGGAGFLVIGCADPEHPQIVAALSTPGWARGVAVAGTHAYVGDSVAGLLVIDLADPSHPAIVGSVDTPGDAYDVAVAGSHAYVADADSGLTIVDIADSALPVVVGNLDAPGPARKVVVSGRLACVMAVAEWTFPPSDFTGLNVIDIANPQSPAILASLPMVGIPADLAISGSFAYVSGNSNSAGYGGLDVVDLADPYHPVFVGGLGTSYGGGVAVANGLVFFSGGGLYALDAADPSAIEIVGWEASAAGGDDIAVEGGLIVGVTGYDESHGWFSIGDCSNPTSPEALGELAMPDYVRDATLVSGYAYVACDGAGLQIIDSTEPHDPRIVGSVDTPGEAWAVAVSGSHAFVADGAAGLQVVDVADPFAPAIVASLSTPCPAMDLALASSATGPLICVQLGCPYPGPDQLLLVDIADPQAPQVVGSVSIPDVIMAVAAAGTLAFVGVNDYPPLRWTFQVFDLSDPSAPQLLGSLDTIAYDIAVQGDYAYVAGGQLTVIDVSEPASPTIVATEGVGTDAHVLVVDGPSAYVWGSYYSTGEPPPPVVAVVDIAEPTNPQYVSGTLGYSSVVAAAYPSVYRATGSSWEVWPARCEPSSAVPGESPAGLAPPLSIYPNPASPQTTIEFALGTAGPVRAAVYDLAGRRVRQLCNGLRDAGPLRLRWNGHDEQGRQVPAGVYLVRVTAAGTSRSARLVLLR